MNSTVTNTRTIRLAKKHSLIMLAGLALAVALSGAIAVSRTGSGGSATVAPAPARDSGWTRTSADDWRTFYYVVADQALADQILLTEQDLQSVIAENQGTPPARTIRVFLVDSPEAEQLLASMMAEALPETTSFVDLRYPPIPAIYSEEPGPFSSAVPAEGDFLPAPGEVIHQPYPCGEKGDILAAFAPQTLAGVCN